MSGQPPFKKNAYISLRPPRLDYYAFRHLPLDTFQGINILFTLFDTLCRISDTVTEPQVARQKLAFFQADIAKVGSGTCHHPETQALATLIKKHPIDLTPFEHICTAVEIDIDRIQSIDDNDLNRYCQKKRGALMLMCGELLNNAPLSPDEKNDLNDLGILIERVILLQERYVRDDKRYLFPIKDFVLNEYVDRTRLHHRLAHLQKPMQILEALYNALLTLLEQTLKTQPDKYISLNPIYALGISLCKRIF